MKLIKRIKKGSIELIHERYWDFGSYHDAFEMLKTEKNGHKFSMPFFPSAMPKPKKNPGIYDPTEDYTDEAYEEMFLKERKKINKLIRKNI